LLGHGRGRLPLRPPRDRARAATGRLITPIRRKVAQGRSAMTAPAWIAVGLLGGLAAAARFAIHAEISARLTAPSPLGILAVNLSGALALGIVAGVALHGAALTIVAGGGIGSFTTFSTWILDSHRLGAAGLARPPPGHNRRPALLSPASPPPR